MRTSACGRCACAQAYTQTVVVTNHLRATVEASIRAGSPERYALAPAALTLRPGQSAAVNVVLRVLKYAARKKAAQAGQRDIFHIKARPCPAQWPQDEHGAGRPHGHSPGANQP